MNSRVAASCSLTFRRIFLAFSMLVSRIRIGVLYVQYSTFARGVQAPRYTAAAASGGTTKSHVPGTDARTSADSTPVTPFVYKQRSYQKLLGGNKKQEGQFLAQRLGLSQFMERSRPSSQPGRLPLGMIYCLQNDPDRPRGAPA